MRRVSGLSIACLRNSGVHGIAIVSRVNGATCIADTASERIKSPWGPDGPVGGETLCAVSRAARAKVDTETAARLKPTQNNLNTDKDFDHSDHVKISEFVLFNFHSLVNDASGDVFEE